MPRVDFNCACGAYLCWLSNLLSDDFPLILIVLLDCCKKSRTLSLWSAPKHNRNANALKTAKKTHLVFSELGIMHVLYQRWSAVRSTNSNRSRAYLVPMFLHAPLRSLRECLSHTSQSVACSGLVQRGAAKHLEFLSGHGLLPSLSHSSYFRYLSSASVSAPQLASTVCSSDFS